MVMEVLSLTPNRIVLRCPEITLKGKNQDDFMQVLAQNVAHRLRAIGARWQVHYAHGRVYADVPATQAAMVETAVEALSEVAGVDSLAATVCLWRDPTMSRMRPLPSGSSGSTSVSPGPRSRWSAGWERRSAARHPGSRWIFVDPTGPLPSMSIRMECTFGSAGTKGSEDCLWAPAVAFWR